jgi:predicted MFS family arabinose efflux permease
MWGIAGVLGLVFAGSTLPTPLYVLYRERFHFSELTLTLIYAAYVGGSLAALLLLGRASDQVGRRRAVLPAVGIAAASTVLFALAANTAMLFAGRVLSGLAVGVVGGAATAWIAELHPEGDKARAARVAAAANVLGLGLGPLLSGLLAQYAPWPLGLAYVLYLAMLGPVVVVTWGARETVRRPVARLADVSLKPRVGVPRPLWGRFVPPAATAFGMFGLFGFYAALIPGVLSQRLHETNHALGGVIVFELCLLGAAAMFATQKLPSRTAMLAGLALLLPGLALLVLAEALRSMPALVGGTALGGISFGLGYRGSLEVVNQISPGGQRAEVLSAYFVVCYVGVAVPVIGIGVLSELVSPAVANLTFASTIAAFAVVALATGTRSQGQ